MSAYLYIGLGVYLAATARHYYMFKGTSAIPIIKGVLFGVLLWPIALIILYMAAEEDEHDAL
jgi:type IV secretory pathway TrbD component